MNDQPWDLNQTWPVGRKRCRFTNAPRISEISGALPKFGAQKNIKFGPLFLLLPHFSWCDHDMLASCLDSV